MEARYNHGDEYITSKESMAEFFSTGNTKIKDKDWEDDGFEDWGITI